MIELIKDARSNEAAFKRVQAVLETPAWREYGIRSYSREWTSQDGRSWWVFPTTRYISILISRDDPEELPAVSGPWPDGKERIQHINTTTGELIENHSIDNFKETTTSG